MNAVAIDREPPAEDLRKPAILAALDKFVTQRSGMDFGNYGDVASYRSEARSITRDLHDYRELRNAVGWRDSVTADMLLEATRAFSGRLTLKDISARYDDGSVYCLFGVEYCTGQYFPTEYRKAACAVLASALWDWTREHAMPAPNSWRVESWTKLGEERTRSKPLQIHEACAELERLGGQSYGHVQPYHDAKTPGDWLRSHFRNEFGRGIASRWFS